jgi:hypothetical protein
MRERLVRLGRSDRDSDDGVGSDAGRPDRCGSRRFGCRSAGDDAAVIDVPSKERSHLRFLKTRAGPEGNFRAGFVSS